MSIMSCVIDGFSSNAETALAYVLLGTFASCMAYTGITEILSVKIAKIVKGNRWLLLGILLIIACASQNIIPISHCIHPDSCSTITEYDEQDETGQTWCCMYHRIWSQSTVYRSSIRIWSDFYDNHPRQHQPECSRLWMENNNW